MAGRSRISRAACVKRLQAFFRRSRFHSVSPAAPKNTRRILLSTPKTSCPWRSKCSTASEPISPLLPVTRIFIAQQAYQKKRIRQEALARSHTSRLTLSPGVNATGRGRERRGCPDHVLVRGGGLRGVSSPPASCESRRRALLVKPPGLRRTS